MGGISCPIIDTHCHVYPDKIADKAVAGTFQFYDAPFTGKKVGLDGTVGMLLKENERSGISCSCICSVATTPHQVHSINRFLAEMAKEHPQQIVALGTLHPDSEDLAADVEEVISLGIRGVKIHPDIQGFALDDERTLRIFELLEGRLPVLLHTGDYRYDFSNPQRLLRVLKLFPRLHFIGAHFGSYSVWEQAPLLFGQENLWVDCSSTLPLLGDEKVIELIRGFGSERVLFGTDYPMWVPHEELAHFLRLPLTEEERENILHRNAEKLFGL